MSKRTRNNTEAGEAETSSHYLIRKCSTCRCTTESELISDDTGTYIECEWCGNEIGVVFDDN